MVKSQEAPNIRLNQELFISGMEKHSLVRALTKWDLTALAVNQIIGAGIFGADRFFIRNFSAFRGEVIKMTSMLSAES